MKEEVTCECQQDNCEPKAKPVFPLWIINYLIVGDNPHLGLAIVKAPDCHIAEQIFKNNSAFNGTVEKIRIQQVKEVFTLPCPDLLAEEYVPYRPPKLPPKREIGKKR